ncbi:3-oxo-tetronate 4-phosphate decarboxylase [Azospirillum canadense]|uniref:3-oxo-tetronate 4-phosphate decarboxylase n=1 Tax=Azospirillum canadense TaxID=403962 RepID=UPI002227D1F5|nr:3-oxo-tetronate 4-phosphate decarboxylase [Azospirillum canadense]MCW2240039.1 ribulose-5-phosphate 4-epimerase/fuculose-1-phosphate aldolase [Azospirillum canadense]
MRESEAREALCRMGELLVRRGLVHGSTGNLSVRLDDGWLVTPTNSSLGELDPARLSRLDSAGRLLDGDQPSKEAFLHRCVYDVRGDATAIIHTHSTHCAAVSCLDHKPGAPVLPPLTAYYVMRVGDLALVPYYRPGDERLALAVKEVAVKHAAILLANHGPVIAGKSLKDAQYALEELEETAKLHFLLHGHPTRPLTAEQVAELNVHFRN